MIHEISIKNFKSFRDEAELSFEPSGNDPYNTVVTMPDGVKLLRFAVVLGANASGKSNLLESIEFLRNFWNRVPTTNDEGTEIEPFLLRENSWTHNTEMKLSFYVDGLRYCYQLTANPERVCREELKVYLTNRPKKVFTRWDENGFSKLYFNPAIVKLSSSELDVMAMNCLRNMSILAVLKKVNVTIPFVSKIREWIDNRLLPMQHGALKQISPQVKKLLADDSAFRNYLLKFAKEADFNISDIRMQKMDAWFAHTVEDDSGQKNFFLPEYCQSSGTQRMVELESWIYLQLQRQAFWAIDEMESSMHPNLMLYVLTKFINTADSQAQLLVSTHYDPILKAIDDIFGKDSVWFTEKGKDGNSVLFSLSDFSG